MGENTVAALAFTPDSRGLICSSSYKMDEYYSTIWDVSPLVGEPGGNPNSPDVSMRDASDGSDTCTVKFTGSEVRIDIEQVNLGCV